jgi:galactonate dehydratase
MSGDDAVTARLAQRYFAELLSGKPLDPFGALVDGLVSAAGTGPDPCTATAISALEQALWDIRGKQLGVPVHALLGGKRRSTIPLYANLNRGLTERTPDAFARRAKDAVAYGFHAVKIAPFDGVTPGCTAREDGARLLNLGLRRIAAVREVVGPAIGFMVDCHGRFDFDEACKLAELLEPYNLRWYEEPIPTRDDFQAYGQSFFLTGAAAGEPSGTARLDSLKNLKARCPLPLAGGEFFFGADEFDVLLDQGALSFVMPDVKHCGGLASALRIAMVADLHSVAVAPHNPSGPVGTIASAHLASVLPQFDILEYQWGDVPWRTELVAPAERIEDGALWVPDLPGLGASLNEDLVSEYQIAVEAEFPARIAAAAGSGKPSPQSLAEKPGKQTGGH